MKPIKSLLAVGALCLSAFAANAQDKELGVFLGTANYQGDLTQQQVTLGETRPSLGVLMRYYFNPRVNLKSNLYLGWIAGDDKNYDDVDSWRRLRNASFSSYVLELSLQGELNIMPYISNSRRYKWAPYIFAGLALYAFNPTAELDGKRYSLQPLGTEGQTLPGGSGTYNRVQGAIPYGFGLKYSLGNYWNLAVEVGQRKLFTDYLDDVSNRFADYDALFAVDPIAARLSDRSRELGEAKYMRNKGGAMKGDPTSLDMYVFAGFTLTKTIRRFSCTGF